MQCSVQKKKKNDYHVIHDTFLVSPSQLKTVNIYSEFTGGHIFHLTELNNNYTMICTKDNQYKIRKL